MAATFSYSRPLIYPDNLSVRVKGSWTDFTAAELAEGTVDYLGTTYAGGVELIYRPFYWKSISFQFVGGINYQNISVTSCRHRHFGDISGHKLERSCCLDVTYWSSLLRYWIPPSCTVFTPFTPKLYFFRHVWPIISIFQSPQCPLIS